MGLIKCFTVVRVSTTSHLITTPELYFYEPIRICECLTSHADDIGVASSKNLFGLFKCADSARSNDGRFKTGAVNCTLDRPDQGNTTSKWTSLIRQYSRHALVAASAGVRVNRLTHLGLMRIFKLPTSRKRKKIEPRACKFNSEIDSIIDVASAWYRLITQEPNANDVIISHSVTYRAI